MEFHKELDLENRCRLLEVLNDWWIDNEFPLDKLYTRIILIYKKGPTDKPENYRPIALFSIGYKLMASMIQKRLSEALDDRIDPAQFGFRRGRSTSQPTHI